MKYAEISALSIEELKTKIQQHVQELHKLEFGHAVSAIPNPMQIRQQRRQIAQLQTAYNAKKSIV